MFGLHHTVSQNLILNNPNGYNKIVYQSSLHIRIYYETISDYLSFYYSEYWLLTDNAMLMMNSMGNQMAAMLRIFNSS